jgi:hypothetical protein
LGERDADALEEVMAGELHSEIASEAMVVPHSAGW